MIAPPVDEEFARAKVHPFPRFISKHPIKVVALLYAAYVVLAVLGVTAIRLTFGAPAGRNPYSPSTAQETIRLDMYANAQDTVVVKSAPTEQQTSSFPGIMLLFELPEPSERIFSPHNLELMRRAQALLVDDPQYAKFCLRCPVEKPRACELAESASGTAQALVAALSNATTSDVDKAATDASQRFAALCNELQQTCDLSKCADNVLTGVKVGEHLGSELAELQKTASSCLLSGATRTEAGVCATVPGCDDATIDKPLCQRPYSPLNYFFNKDGQLGNIDNGWETLNNEIELPEPSQLRSRVSWYPASFYLPRDYEESGRRAHMTRLTAPLGLPLEGYTDANDRFEEQEAQLNAYLSTLWPKVEALRKENEVSGERVMLTWVVNFDVLSSYFMALLQVDIRFAAAALCFVIAYTAFHTRSVFVSCLSLIGVVLCFAVGCFWTIRVAQVTYFDPLNIFLLFVLIGIGADGIYIVSDAWTQSAEAVPYWNALHGDEEGLAYRMSYVWRRSSKAMFATNLTTMLAFISNVPSPVMPMSAFGVLSSFAVIHNLVLDVVAVPAIILIWDTYLKEKRACCCLSRTPEQAAGGGGPLRMVARFLAGPIVGHPPAESEPSSANPTPAQPTGSAGGVHTRGIVESFFADRYAPFILRFRFVVAAVMLALVGTMAFYTTRLEASKESPQFLPDSNPVWRGLLSLRDGWLKSDTDARTELYLVWGAASNDYEGHSKYAFATPACDEGSCGSAVWDRTFDPSPPDAQQYLADICDKAAELKAPGPNGEPHFIYDKQVSHCLMQAFRGFLAESSTAFPIHDAREFWRKLRDFLREPTEERSGGRGYSYIRQKLTRIGEEGNDRLYFMISAIETTFDPALFYSIGEVVEPHGNAIRFEQTWNADKPKGASDFFVSTSSGLFTSMRMQQAYVSSTFTGVLMALGLALGSLMVFVGNVVVALLAFLCIASVVCCTLGTMVLLGWSLGAIEAICAVVVVGFAVDFCAHLAIAYAEAPERTRAERVTRALASVGISVMSGAITTLGASALLFATTIQYLFKFGVFMMMTVGFSLVTSNLLFVSLLAIMGPEGDVGSISVALRRCSGTADVTTDETMKTTGDAPLETDTSLGKRGDSMHHQIAVPVATA